MSSNRRQHVASPYPGAPAAVLTGEQSLRVNLFEGTPDMLRIRLQENIDSPGQVCAICGVAFASSPMTPCLYDDDTRLGWICAQCAGLEDEEIPARLREGGTRLAMLAQELIEDAERRVSLADRIESGQESLVHESLTLYIGD
jgi:hypothetical protein